MTALTPFLCLLLILIPAVAPAAPPLTLITEENPPFNHTEHGQLTGATTAVVREIARRLALSDEIAVLPWARGYKRLRTEPNVVLFTTARTAERDPQFHWVGPLYTVRLVFYARKGDARRIDSMDMARQAGVIGTYKDDFREQLLTALGFTNLDSSKSPHSNVRKLLSGRVDLWFYDNVGAPQVTREAGFDPEALEPVYTYQQTHSYIALSKQTAPAVVDRWQATLDEMKADGTFWWLTRRWLPPDAIVAEGRHTAGAPFSLQLYTENAPPSSYEADGTLTGLSVDIVHEILRRIGQTASIELVPWARGYKRTLSDADSALFSTTRLPQRETRFFWVGPLYEQHWGFYRWKGAGVEVADMAGARRVSRIGTYHQDAKMQYLKALGFDNLVPTNNNVTNLTHLQRGNIDLWVSSDFNMPHLARQAGISPSRLELAFAFHTVGNYIAFSKRTSLHVVRLWQSVLDEMKADGSYLRICQRYGYEPRNGGTPEGALIRDPS